PPSSPLVPYTTLFRSPFVQSHASAPLTLLTCAGITVLTLIPFTPLGTILGFAPLPLSYFAFLIPCILLYMALATSLKKAYVRHRSEEHTSELQSRFDL